MNTITAILEPDVDGTLHLPLPKTWRHQKIRVKAELELLGTPLKAKKARAAENLKGFGCLRGKVALSTDFNEPLDEFKDYMA